ncbi:20739_t:CDS:1, partial [Gigaspora margarita]
QQKLAKILNNKHYAPIISKELEDAGAKALIFELNNRIKSLQSGIPEALISKSNNKK